MRRFCRNPVLALALAIVPSILYAQAPTITPNGDPSVADDTIYKLYVDSIAYPHQSTVVLLDDGVVQVERDGRTSTTYRQVVQVLQKGLYGRDELIREVRALAAEHRRQDPLPPHDEG